MTCICDGISIYNNMFLIVSISPWCSSALHALIVIIQIMYRTFSFLVYRIFCEPQMVAQGHCAILQLSSTNELENWNKIGQGISKFHKYRGTPQRWRYTSFLSCYCTIGSTSLVTGSTNDWHSTILCFTSPFSKHTLLLAMSLDQSFRITTLQLIHIFVGLGCASHTHKLDKISYCLFVYPLTINYSIKIS